MSDSQSIYKELKLISNYLGLITAKYVTIILLVIVYYPMRPTPAYILAAIIISPLLIRYALSMTSQTDASKKFILYPTARKYSFTIPKYKAEKITYPLIVFFMAAWQLSINHYNVYINSSNSSIPNSVVYSKPSNITVPRLNGFR